MALALVSHIYMNLYTSLPITFFLPRVNLYQKYAMLILFALNRKSKSFHNSCFTFLEVLYKTFASSVPWGKILLPKGHMKLQRHIKTAWTNLNYKQNCLNSYSQMRK